VQQKELLLKTEGLQVLKDKSGALPMVVPELKDIPLIIENGPNLKQLL
jgi:hypothetical protein